MLEQGKILQDRYRIEKQIGQGGMGAVYVAVDQRFGSTVAIKETLFLGENFEKAFEREARLLNSLRHHALPNVRDYFSEGHTQFLVMEFIPGEDLFEKLEKNGKAFKLEEVLNWSKQLLEALEFLHTQEIPVIHRDIKPQNLKLTPQGQIILLDFGLAKGNPTDASHLTNAKSVFGYSRNYASLEQMQGTGTDPRSDLYSLSATIYHLLTGNPPVDALTRAMSVLSEQADPLIPANQIHPQVPKGIANILNKAMNLNANQRPASAKEMLEMLNNSENYETEETANAAVAKSIPTSFLNQETRILPSESANLTAKNSVEKVNTGEELTTEINQTKYSPKDYKTNVIGGNIYQEQNPKSRKSVFAIGAFLSLLLFVLGASAFYFLNTNEAKNNPEKTNENELKNSPTELKINVVNANLKFENENIKNETVTANPNSNSKTPVNTEVKVQSSPKPKPAEKIWTGKGTGKNETEMVFVDPEEGNVRIKGNTIETDRIIINENGIIYKKTPVPPKPPNVENVPIPSDQLQKLTPRQRQKLIELRTKIKRRQQTNVQSNIVQTPEKP